MKRILSDSEDDEGGIEKIKKRAKITDTDDENEEPIDPNVENEQQPPKDGESSDEGIRDDDENKG